MAVSPVLLLTALLACVSLCSAAVWQQTLETVPGHENQCWVAEQEKFYDAGATWSEPDCIRGICGAGGTRIERQSCGTVSCGPGLKKLEGNKDAAYPDCCGHGCIPA